MLVFPVGFRKFQLFIFMSLQVVILANGIFPFHSVPLTYLRNAEHIICCDGSVNKLHAAGMEPEAVVGDLDSIESVLLAKYSDRLYRSDDQETNDLTKAVAWSVKNKYDDIIILGATGKREDHTIGNISLLAEYAKQVNVIMVTDFGTFLPILESSIISSFAGQQLSLFSVNPDTEISSKGLKYELTRLRLKNWWRGTLNESTGDSFEIRFKGGPVIIFQKFRE